MRLVRRRVPANGIDHELIWLLVSVTAGAIGLLAFGFGLNWPRCPFLAITGFPCLTCGATRATINDDGSCVPIIATISTATTSSPSITSFNLAAL